ncbi:hypothetical protein DFH07DRAFT_983607 [Mycena maculata]|uniref:Uncharacterized protein n=1 Tax=Mycena maculata TaxID=230809 RepID=A0AAD7MZV8_9AGAR|nr:hypothetical protein DFH07DRAFT_983607 [Mycena maculata]
MYHSRRGLNMAQCGTKIPFEPGLGRSRILKHFLPLFEGTEGYYYYYCCCRNRREEKFLNSARGPIVWPELYRSASGKLLAVPQLAAADCYSSVVRSGRMQCKSTAELQTDGGHTAARSAASPHRLLHSRTPAHPSAARSLPSSLVGCVAAIARVTLAALRCVPSLPSANAAFTLTYLQGIIRLPEKDDLHTRGSNQRPRANVVIQEEVIKATTLRDR